MATKNEDKFDKLSAAQKARIERNRQRALLLRQASIARHPHKDLSSQSLKRTIDTGAGFLLEEEDQDVKPAKIVSKAIPNTIIDDNDRLFCEDCSKEFIESYLYSNFTASVCDLCRDPESKHKLITKTEAKNQYLLKDCDFDIREPALKFIMKKNPHYQHGEMKLYLTVQVYDRAMEVWETEENLEAEHEKRSVEREKRKNKKYVKKMKDLRMNVRSSLYKRNLQGHQHEYGPEECNSDTDECTQTCTTCGFVLKYEKM